MAATILPTQSGIHPDGFYIYVHRHATDGAIFYVGKGKGSRAWATAGRTEYWNRIARKHGRTVEIVQSGMREWWALELERDLIALHGDALCNLTDGGETSVGYKFTDEAKAKISAGNKGKRRTPEQRERLKALFSTDEHRAKLRAAAKLPHVLAIRAAVGERVRGKPISDAQRATLAKMNSPECRARARAAQSTPEYLARLAASISRATKGKKFARHILEAARAATVKRMRCVETGVEFDSIADAVAWLKRTGQPKAGKSPLINAATGRRGYRSAYGYHWQYA